MKRTRIPILPIFQIKKKVSWTKMFELLSKMSYHIIYSGGKITIAKESFTETNNFLGSLYGCLIPVHFVMKFTVIQWQDSG